MERNTLLAVVLSVIVITVGFTVQNMLMPPPTPAPEETVVQDESSPGQGQTGQQSTGDASGRGTTDTETSTPQIVQVGAPVRAVSGESISSDPVIYKNDLMEVTIDPAGARVTSIKLTEHDDGNQPVEMVMRGETDRAAFELKFGGPDAPVVTDLFRRVASTDPNTFKFERQFYIQGGEDVPFTVTRTYRFYPGEYMFEVKVGIRNSQNAFVPLDYDGVSYTLTYGPQIGPSYEDLDNRQEFRNFIYYVNDKRENIRLRSEDVRVVEERVQWIGIVGKYFTVLGVPDATEYAFTVSNQTPVGLRDGAFLSFTRPVIRSAANEDVFRFYVGPKVNRVLDRYNDPDENALGVRNLDLDAAVDSRFLFGWLENILKWIMQLLYRVVPNYGLTIILLTIIVKALLFPLTHKSYESTSRMQAMQPKINELREKYKNDPQKMNAAMADMYKKEGVNPLGGCLPMLAQFPFFIAMFGLFNNHFDLRGATFIPGWITDLAAPDSIISWSTPIPLLNWTDIRLLPILFLASQLLTSKLMQSPGATSNNQTKMMQFGLPIVFFFVLYNMPSGLLVYWFFSNVLTVGQQYYINRKRKATE